MTKKELEALASKDTDKKDAILAVKISKKVLDKLEKKGYNIPRTVQDILARLAE